MRGGQLWEPHPGREPGTDDRENRREPLINLVRIDRWKRLRHLNQNGKGSSYRALTSRYAVHDSPGGEVASKSSTMVKEAERGKPHVLLNIFQET